MELMTPIALAFVALLVVAAALFYRRLRRLVGRSEDTYDPFQDPVMFAQAMQLARLNFAGFVLRLNAPQAGDHGFAVKVPVPIGSDTAHVWLDQVKVDGDHVQGRISQPPAAARHLRAGQEWQTAADDISDWTFRNGAKTYGNFILRASKYAVPAQLRQVFEERFADLENP